MPGTAAAVLLEIRNVTGVVPEIYFEWTEGNPLNNMFRFLITGRGEIAPVTREVLRETEPNAKRRPSVHWSATTSSIVLASGSAAIPTSSKQCRLDELLRVRSGCGRASRDCERAGCRRTMDRTRRRPTFGRFDGQ